MKSDSNPSDDTQSVSNPQQRIHSDPEYVHDPTAMEHDNTTSNEPDGSPDDGSNGTDLSMSFTVRISIPFQSTLEYQ